MARKGLGKGLDSLFPDILNEDFDSNSPQSLADMLGDEEEPVEDVIEDIESKNQNDDKKDDEVSGSEEIQEDDDENAQEETATTKDSNGDADVQTSQELQVQKEHIEEVRQIVEKNPRITLWSSKSSAVFRYLRKTEPEFSISKEASLLIEEAVSKKYPEIWELFKDL